VEKATLANGLKVQFVRRTAVPVVGFSLLIDAGYAADRSATPGTARLALDMLDEGTTTRTSEQISERLAALGASINMFCDLDACHVTLNALRDKLDPSLEIYTDVLLNPSFLQKDLDRIKPNTLARIQQEKVQPVAMALRVLPLLLYGPGHAYGMPLTGSGTEETVRAMTRDDLRRFHRTWFHPGNATMLVAGDITMAELRPKLETAFAAWPSGEAARKEITEPPVRPSSEVFFLDRPGAEQTVILAAQLAPPKKYARELAFQLFNDAFGGAFASRVNLNLREDKHWAYGAGSFAFDARGQRLWFVYAPVQTDKTRESLQEMVKELRDVTGSRRLSAEELQEAKDRQTRTLAGRWETANAVLGAMREMVGYELPEDYYATFAQRAAAVTIADVQRVVDEVLRPDRQVYVLVGDRTKFEAGVRELKLGPVHLLDADGRPQER
jgi:zinc protease